MEICPVVKEHQNKLNGYTDLAWLMEHIKTCAHCIEIMQFMVVSLESVLDVVGAGAVEPVWPEKLLITVFGKEEWFESRGAGAYPYDCPAKEKWPQSVIYFNDTGGWVPSHDLEKVGSGYHFKFSGGAAVVR